MKTGISSLQLKSSKVNLQGCDAQRICVCIFVVVFFSSCMFRQALVQGSAESEKQLGLLRDELLAKMPAVPDLQPLQDELLRLSKRTEAEKCD